MPAPTFLIKNGDSDFMSRQKSIFDVLSIVEKEISLSRTCVDNDMELDEPQVGNINRKRTKRFRGKESIFKVPMEPPPKFRKPYPTIRRGRRWIKYSLADVSDYDMSDEGNTAAAISCLKDLRERKAMNLEDKNGPGSQNSIRTPCVNNGETQFGNKDKMDANSSFNSKHLFNASCMYNEAKDEEKDAKAVFKKSVLVMPEYVVGQNKKAKKNIQKCAKTETKKEIYLDHIHLYEDE